MSVRLVLSSTKTQYVREKGKGKETARTRDLDGDRERLLTIAMMIVVK